ncbi:MAG: YfhO family protein, partial [Clostridia bacterium]|nr:YfhO family protein [Clostridia bacterium]
YFILLDKRKKILKVLIFLMLFSEVLYSSCNCININYQGHDYLFSVATNAFENNKNLISEIKERDKSFFRIYKYGDIVNSGLLYGYNSLELFSSIYNDRIFKFYKKNSYTDFTTVNNLRVDAYSLELMSLLNTKYIIDQENNIEVNEYSLPLGFLIKNTEMLEKENYDLEDIYQYLADTDKNIYVNLDDEVVYENVEANDSGELILNEDQGKIAHKFTSSVDGIIEFNKRYGELEVNGQIVYNELNYIKAGDKIKVTYYIFKDEEIKIEDLPLKVLDLNNFKTIVDDLNNKALDVDISDKSHIICGYINVEENGEKLFLSIPYDKFIEIKVDGQKMEFNEEFETFISVNLNKGYHKIIIDYKPTIF